MSRKIKFRAWDDKNKKWLLGYEYKNIGGFSLTGECVLFGEWGGVFDTFLFNKDGKNWNDLKIMEFTGQKDKNEIDIYEGDIVNDDELGNGIVIFQSGCFFMMYDADTNMEFLGLKTDKFGRLQEKRIVEILGNIYENPELLSTI